MEEQKRRFEVDKKAALAAAKAQALAELDADSSTTDVIDEEPKGEHPAQVEEKEAVAAAADGGGANPEEIFMHDDDE